MQYTIKYDIIETKTDKAVLFGFLITNKIMHTIWMPMSLIEVDNRQKRVSMNKWLFKRVKDTNIKGAPKDKQYFVSYIEDFIVDKSDCIFPKLDFDVDLEETIAL